MANSDKVNRFFKKEKRSAERVAHDAAREVKKAAREVEHTIRPPWYRRTWNRIKSVFTRRR